MGLGIEVIDDQELADVLDEDIEEEDEEHDEDLEKEPQKETKVDYEDIAKKFNDED